MSENVMEKEGQVCLQIATRWAKHQKGVVTDIVTDVGVEGTNSVWAVIALGGVPHSVLSTS